MIDDNVESKYYYRNNYSCMWECLQCLQLNLVLDLQASTLALDFRVTALEENGGSDGNSSVAELEVRVETLEGTAAEHETRILAAETDINGNVFKLDWSALEFYSNVILNKLSKYSKFYPENQQSWCIWLQI